MMFSLISCLAWFSNENFILGHAARDMLFSQPLLSELDSCNWLRQVILCCQDLCWQQMINHAVDVGFWTPKKSTWRKPALFWRDPKLTSTGRILTTQMPMRLLSNIAKSIWGKKGWKLEAMKQTNCTLAFKHLSLNTQALEKLNLSDRMPSRVITANVTNTNVSCEKI